MDSTMQAAGHLSDTEKPLVSNAEVEVECC